MLLNVTFREGYVQYRVREINFQKKKENSAFSLLLLLQRRGAVWVRFELDKRLRLTYRRSIDEEDFNDFWCFEGSFEKVRLVREKVERLEELVEERLIGWEEPLEDEVKAIKEYRRAKGKGREKLIPIEAVKKKT